MSDVVVVESPAKAKTINRNLGGGYTVLVHELVRRSEIKWIAAAVDGIDAAGQGWSLRDTTGAETPADGVIFALPAARLAGLVGAVAPRTAAAAGRI